ncbi:LysR family transcriptional regulator [Fusobacterium sp.]|uniref:LysR family transcriptional regulator n=1 Tax=Fusobacterium sp. TaxID=68766 RepID=UPI0029026493|nr:LysR family transcriptional regulator [Fusobacterium sp.]MDU1910101.1 LysR family transcriptional regulator [Fusobacterium sp.]
MDIDKIESFVTLAEIKHFAKASEVLYISQPALSKRIQALEDELNVPLFNRIGKKIFLTVQGEYFKKYAEEMLASYYNAREYIKQIENLEHGTLNFGATNFIGVYLMPEFISKFYNKYPKIEINMVINSSKNILNMLHKNQLEFIFLSDYIVEDDNYYVINKYIDDNLKLIVGNKHRLFGQKSCSLFDIADDLYITKEPTSSQSRFLDKIFKKYNFNFNNKLFISHQEAIKESVINNIGISILSVNSVRRELESGLVRALDFDEENIQREIQYVHIKNKFLTPAANEFIKLISE